MCCFSPRWGIMFSLFYSAKAVSSIWQAEHRAQQSWSVQCIENIHVMLISSHSTLRPALFFLLAINCFVSYSSNITDFKLEFHEGFLLGSAKATIFGCEFPMILLFWAARSTQVSRCCLYPILRIHKFFVLESLLLVRHHHLQSSNDGFYSVVAAASSVLCAR